MDSWSGTLEGNFGVELTGTIFFPCLKRKKLTKLLCSQYHCVVSTNNYYITSGSHVIGTLLRIHFTPYDVVKPS